MAASMGTDRAPGAGQDVGRWPVRWWPWHGGEAGTAAGMLAALAYYYLVPNPLLALPGLVAFAALAWLRLELALCLLPLTFPFWYVPKRALGQAVFPLSEIALGVCLAVAIGRLLVAGIRGTGSAEIAKARGLRVAHLLFRREWRWLVIGAALLLVGTAAGVLVAVRPREALRAFRWEVAEPLLYAGLVIACLWGRRTLRGDDTRPGSSNARGDGRERLSGQLIGWLAGPVIAVGTLFGMLAIAQVFWLHVGFAALAAGNRLVTQTPGASLLRATGIYYGSANSLGALLERVLPLALAFLLWRVFGVTENAKHAKARGEGERLTTEETEETEERAERAIADEAEDTSAAPASNSVGARHFSPAGHGVSLLLGCCVLVMVAGLVLSVSRGAEVGAAAGVLLVLLAHPRTRRVAIGIVLLGAIVAAALWQAGMLQQAALAGHGASGEVRLLLWQSALHMIRDHPLLGIGPDQFLYYYDPAYTAHPYWIPRIGGHLTPAVYEPDLAHPHNLVLDLWLSGGVLGLAGFALVLGWLGWSCWHVWRTNQPATARCWSARTALVVGVAGGVFAGLTHGMVDSAYFQPDLALLFWWAVAVVALLRGPSKDSEDNAAPRSQSARALR